MSKSNNINWNIPDADDSPPPAYEASAPPFNPNFIEHPPSSSSSHPHYIEPTPIHQNTTVNTNTIMSSPFPNNHSNNNNNININNNDTHTYSALYPQTSATQHHRPLYQPVQMPMPQSTPIRQYHPTSYHTMPIPVTYTTHTQNRQRKGFPLAALFFLFGFFCPPLWVVGACCCASSRNEYEAWWGKVNFVMAMGLIISSIIFSAVTLSDYF